MKNAKLIAEKENVAGELFDLSIASLNNDFGWYHITGIMKYGINFPLDKFINELDMILDNGGPKDEKSPKREARRKFLKYCNSSREIQNLFPIFCNYINGGGDHTLHRDTWENKQYRKNLFIITVAGGNIITLFAQLIVNMIDCFTEATNNIFYNWDIHSDSYMPQKFNDDVKPIRDYMFNESFRNWYDIHDDIINKTYSILTETNRLLLNTLENTSNFSKEEICFIICSHFLKNDHDGNKENQVRFVATSPYSDFDYKLSPNIDPNILKSYESGITTTTRSNYRLINELTKKNI